MSRIEHLLKTSRPAVTSRAEHRRDLRTQLWGRYDDGAGGTFLARHPEYAVLALVVAGAFICWMLSLALIPLSPAAPQTDIFAEAGWQPVRVERVSARAQVSLAAYARMFIPRPLTIDFGLMEQAMRRNRDRDESPL
ncbi:hypothetical protein CVU37_03800 [candidate division BRC1 bacterium HGW-BRC1-1]|jgi:hypothetical protein|nr:MAG: hypothetical protein CVU37_03800 [candidate division BRC1 bacterium HGW-BRC1-1]